MSAAPNGDWANAGAHRHLDRAAEDMLIDHESRQPAGRWHVGREISLAVLAFLGLQTVTLVWYAAKLDSRVATLEGTVSEQGAAAMRSVEDREAVHNRLTALEVKIETILEATHRIEIRLAPPR